MLLDDEVGVVIEVDFVFIVVVFDCWYFGDGDCWLVLYEEWWCFCELLLWVLLELWLFVCVVMRFVWVFGVVGVMCMVWMMVLLVMCMG